MTILEIGDSEAGPYLAMEFVRGETLRQRLDRGPVSLADGLRIASQVCEGLAVAHQAGIVHRDLKPENIMVRVDEYVKLVDFGLAKVLPWGRETESGEMTAETVTRTGELVGTFNYMSPEQARGQRVEPTSDVFSLGVVLYELLTGEHPFRGATTADTLNAILSKEPVPVRTARREVSKPLSDLVDRCLRKEADERFPTGAEVVGQLDPAAVELSPGQTGAGRLRSRSPHNLAAAAIVLVLLAWAIFNFLPWGPDVASVESVAVMDFRIDPNEGLGEFGAEIPLELTTALAREGLAVASRSSVTGMGVIGDPRSFRDRLGVDAVLGGEIGSYRGSLRLYLELIDTRTGFQLWSRVFELDPGVLIDGGEEVARGIAVQVMEALNEPND